MAEMTIRLRINPETGKKDIVVGLRSDEDALPHEHEQHHRQLVNKLIEGGVLRAGEAGNVVIEREEDRSATDTSTSRDSHQQRQAEQEGG